jgi:hypothetical protein
MYVSQEAIDIYKKNCNPIKVKSKNYIEHISIHEALKAIDEALKCSK